MSFGTWLNRNCETRTKRRRHALPQDLLVIPALEHDPERDLRGPGHVPQVAGHLSIQRWKLQRRGSAFTR